MTIQSLSGPVTTTEISSFLSFMQSQTPPPTPWGAVNGTTGDHNEWADGTGGRDLEAMGEMFEVSSNLALLNLMISWADDCTSQRNDLMSAANGGQRVMWTGKVDEVWCPNEPSSANAGYAGSENEDTEGHLAYCAKLILENPALWPFTVPDGDPYHYGATYFQRATNYLFKCDEANDEYTIKWFISPTTSLIIAPTSSAWTVFNENVTAINRQMMFTSGFQRLAEAHELLGDNPARVAQYDAMVLANVNQDLTGMVHFHPYTTNGQPVYDWGYYPNQSAPEATEIHAEYDIIGVWRAFYRTSYGYTLAPLVPFANTMINVIYLGTNNFAGNVDGSGGIQSPIYSGWLLPADWNPAVYTTVAGSAYSNGWYSSSADIDAGILFMKNRRYLEFSVASKNPWQVVSPGVGTNFTVAVTSLGGFTNNVSLTVNGLPAGASGNFSPATVNLATLTYAATNTTLSISTTGSTPPGTYPLSLMGTSGSVAHTNIVLLIVGTYGLLASPTTQTVYTGGTNISYTVTVVTNGSFGGSVALGVSGLPVGASASFSPSALNSGGTTIFTVTTGTAAAGNYLLTLYGTNGTSVASTTVTLVVNRSPQSVWSGGSATDSNWSDAANWNGNNPLANDALYFGGTTRLSNVNDTTTGTTYSSLVFNAGAGAFVLGGNPVTLGGGITNNALNPQTIDLALRFSSNFTFNGAAGPLVLGGGLTNALSGAGFTTLTLAGSGILTNLLGSTTSPGGTNELVLNNGTDNWTLLNNASSATMTVPWALVINGGTFNFGSASSAPNLTSTTPNGNPSDNEIGTASGVAGTLNLSNGTYTTSGRFDTALAGNSTGILNQSGGTFNMGSQFQGANGSNSGEVSTVNLSGGTMNIAGGSGAFYLASRGTGTLNVSGAAVLNCGTLDVSRNANGNATGSVGVVNLNGGRITASRVGTATANAQTNWLNGSAATFNFNGGTLRINSSMAPFFQGSTVAPIIPIHAVVQAGGAVIDSNGNTNTFAEPLQHDSTLGSTPDGGLSKNGAGTLILISNVTYTGSTLINAGTLAVSNAVALGSSPLLSVAGGAALDASGRSDSTLTLVGGQTLTGTGGVKGNVVAGYGAILAPGGSVGMLSFSNSLVLMGGSTTMMEVNKSVSPSNDLAQVTGPVVYGGTLVVTNIGTISFAAGDSFKLFNAANYSGAFTNVLPILPGINLAWNTNTLANGVLSVVSAPTPPPQFGALMVDSGNVVLAGSNGVPGWTYYMLASTNLALPLNQWPCVATNAFDAAGNFNLTNLLVPGAPQVFYQVEEK